MARRWIPDKRVPGLGVLQLPSGVATWYVRFRVQGGRQITHRIGRISIINASIARDMAMQILASSIKGEYKARNYKAITMASLLERIKREHWPRLRLNTQRQQELLWRLHLLPAIGRTKVAALTSDDVARWFHQASVKPITANRALEVLSKAMNLAELWNLRPLHSNPCRHITANRERKRRRYLSRDELARLLAALDQSSAVFAQMIRLLLLTGCRVGEIQRARWDWVNLDARILVIPAAEHKTGGDGNDRVVHLPPAAVEILRQLRQRTNGRWIIPGRGDAPLVSYSKPWARLLERAGISGLRVHDLRHSHASFALEAGLTLAQIGELLGHRSAQTTQRYAHLSHEAAATNVAKVAGLLNLASAKTDDI